MFFKSIRSKKILFSFFSLLYSINVQATFSIAAVDTVTGEVGSAAATCLNNYNLAPNLTYIVPGHGAVNYQAYLYTGAFPKSSEMILAGNTASEVMAVVNNADANYQRRQRLIITMHSGDIIEKSVFTGTIPKGYGGHASEIIGYNYVIGGNLLAGRHVLEKMEVAFNTAGGDLTHKLMMSLKAASTVVGADQRCLNLGVSSATAYVRVAKKNDPLNKPSFIINYNKILGGIDPVSRVYDLYLSKRPDTDNDGVPDMLDAFPNDPKEQWDWNSDGIGDSKDLGASDYLFELDAGFFN